MPLTINERELLLGIFRLTMAVSAHRVDDASREFSNLLTTYEEQIRNLTTFEQHCNDEQVSTISDSGTHVSMPSLVRIYNPLKTPSVTDSVGFKPADNNVELIITEPVQVQVEVPKRITRENAVIELQQEEEEEEEEEEQEQEEEQEEEVEEEEEQEVEEEEQEQEEVEEELELVPVRIKKVTYWKDEKSGDIYEYLPGDECGEKVGTYVDGKATFS